MPQFLPQLLGNMWCERSENQNEFFNNRFWPDRLFAEVIYKNHHLADGGIETKTFDVIADLLYRLMQQPHRCLIRLCFFDNLIKPSCFFINNHSPCFLQKSIDSFYA